MSFVNDSEVRRCGRPKRDGSPCQGILGMFDIACPVHKTEDDLATRKVIIDAYLSGIVAGQADAERSLAHKAIRLQEKLDDVERMLRGLLSRVREA